MPKNNTVTKEDLRNEINNAVAELTKLIIRTAKETTSTTEARLTAEMNKRFQRADRQRQAFRKEIENRFLEIEGKMMNRFDLAKQYTDDVVVKRIAELKTLIDGQAGMADHLKLEQMTLGALQDKIRADHDETKNSHDTEITDLKRRVTVLEKEAFSSSANDA